MTRAVKTQLQTPHRWPAARAVEASRPTLTTFMDVGKSSDVVFGMAVVIGD